MQAAEGFLSKLLNGSDQEKTEAWKDFLFDLAKVKGLDHLVNPELVQAVLTSGRAYGGARWTVARSAKVVYQLTGQSVLGEFLEFRAIWLMALALYWNAPELLDIPQSQQGAEAAHFLAALLSEDSEEVADETASLEEAAVLAWETPEEKAPPVFKKLWEEVMAGTRKLPLAVVLDSVPVYAGLPQRPLDAGVPAGKADRNLRAYQQSI